MKYVDLRHYMRGFTVFSINDIKRCEEKFYRRRLNEWQDKGYIKKVIKGFYIFSDTHLNEERLFEIANRIYSPSYISFETALSYYGLIPEAVYIVISATTRKTYAFDTTISKFSYRHLKPEIFFGYNLIPYEKEKCYKIATPEKALLDFFYLNASLKDKKDFESLRINKDVFREVIDKKKFNIFLNKFKEKALDRRMANFLDWINHA